ncbi:MAG TPA: cytochrome P450 [Pseudonocardiaceae bacterium]|jgi:cytochrome P450|nr:cytochrome P450 [Pseudonocardiaceae bacterium]
MTETVSTRPDARPNSTFPVLRRCPVAAPEEYGQLREEGPLVKVTTVAGQQVWWATTHGTARAILADPRFSSDRTRDGYPLFFTDAKVRENVRNQPRFVMIGMDGADHSRTRRSAIGEFTVKRLAALRPRIQEIVDEFVDEMLAREDRPVDLVQALSLPIPSLVICELLGVPYADHDFFQQRSGKLLSRSTGPEQRQAVVTELRAYLGGLIDAKTAEPADDLLSRLIAKQQEIGDPDREELVGMAFLLLVAGHETTANMISLGTVGFLENPEQLAAIKDDPAKIPMAVEEMLRYFSIADMVTRVAAQDVEIGGVTVKAGEGVIASTMSANRDSGTFADADKLDIERGARHHVAFGYGPHQCLGQNLARQELEIVFETLFRRIPNLKLAASLEDIPFKDDGLVYGVHRLPVTW